MPFDLTRSRERQPTPDAILVADDLHAMLVAWNSGGRKAREEALAIADANRRRAPFIRDEHGDRPLNAQEGERK